MGEKMNFEKVVRAVGRIAPDTTALSEKNPNPLVWRGPFVVEEETEGRPAYVASAMHVVRRGDDAAFVQVKPFRDSRPVFLDPSGVSPGPAPGSILITSAEPEKPDVLVRPVTDGDGKVFFGEDMDTEQFAERFADEEDF